MYGMFYFKKIICFYKNCKKKEITLRVLKSTFLRAYIDYILTKNF